MLIRNGRVIDGSVQPAFAGDEGVVADFLAGEPQRRRLPEGVAFSVAVAYNLAGKK